MQKFVKILLKFDKNLTKSPVPSQGNPLAGVTGGPGARGGIGRGGGPWVQMSELKYSNFDFNLEGG